ncbi:hypothetical protein K2173_024528 [Erythroxylum novogranatense]|uniref:SHSP domain-containing protein n=1 Tax=Erythroxylum novogranatense TaxID=1862640 RepID=A0AAV8SUU9_9ROSI|nr:hypothetical protein K2173_024528 [Erythroxylum novogranatense]
MSIALDTNVFDSVNHLFSIPESIEKFMYSGRSNENNENRGVGSIPADILETPKDYIFQLDLPGLSKSDVQATVEDENILVIKTSGKRKREDGEEEGCKYIRLERRVPQKLMRKFRLPENANVSSIKAKCESGVLTVVVEKQPPPPKPKKVEITIS